MDKNTIYGFVLIGLVLIVWMWMQSPSVPPPQHGAAADSIRRAAAVVHDTVRTEHPVVAQRDTLPHTPEAMLGAYFASRAAGVEKTITVQTDFYTAELTTHGGLIRTWELHRYKTWDGHPVELIDYDHGGDLSLLFTSGDGKLVNTRQLYFDAREGSLTNYTLSGDGTVTVEFTLPVGGEKS